MVPFYTFYSMFGFQRVGDLIWQAADIRARGFLMAATAGRTTLMGEGLQHQDGHSLVLASTVPAVQAYDPAFAYEVGAIVRAGIDRMYGGGPADWTDVFGRDITLYNETYEMPVLPEVEGLDQQIVGRIPVQVRRRTRGRRRTAATILFSGVTHLPARGWLPPNSPSTTAWPLSCGRSRRTRHCARTGCSAERHNRLHPSGEQRTPLVAQRLAESAGPITAVSDFMAIVPDQIRQFVAGRTFNTLGTDGMGRSDTREALRRFFEIDTGHVVVAVLSGLLADGKIDASVVEDALVALTTSTSTPPTPGPPIPPDWASGLGSSTFSAPFRIKW